MSDPKGPCLPPQLARIGWRADSPAAAALAGVSSPEQRLGRVVEQHRAGYRVSDGEDIFHADAPIHWRRGGVEAQDKACVGDWVLVDTAQCISRRLPRRSLFKRAAAGEHYAEQPIAANLDTVFVVSGLDDDFNVRRIERYLLLIAASGAEAVVLLTKKDRYPDRIEPAEAELAGLAGAGVPVRIVNAKDPADLAALDRWLGPGQTAVLVGSSGAGKSTLMNTLLGREAMKTGAVRETDSRGRHTTTHRALLPLPTGGCLIDTPGMRELKPTGEKAAVTPAFDDIVALAMTCRFNDCQHRAEPGCALRAAAAAGTLEPARLEHYLKLGGEIAAAARSRADRLAPRPSQRPPRQGGSRILDDQND